MTLTRILDTILLEPLRLLFELVFGSAIELFGQAGWAILLLSLVMNLLLHPFYKQADRIQAELEAKERQLADGVRHIKKSFSGEERMMMLQTYYRQNHYKQTDALRGSIALLLEIPFFITAYQFISGLQLLHGVSFGIIRDLALPDRLLAIGSLEINLLPLLMTLLNVLSTVLFTKGAGKKMKIQLYGMAAFFLIFLYNSPSALLIYWSMNNLISLLKNVVTYYAKRRLEAKQVSGNRDDDTADTDRAKDVASSSRRLFFSSAVFLTILIGVLIPATFIAASPQEYINIYRYEHPSLFVLSSASLAVGVFLVWLPLFYRLTPSSLKQVLARLLAIVAALSIVNYMFFGQGLGVISASLQYERPLQFEVQDLLINGAVLLLVAILFYFLTKFQSRRVIALLLLVSISTGAMSAWHLTQIHRSVQTLELKAPGKPGDDNKDMPHFSLSQEGKNVVVMMFDRAAGSMLPYILNEKPELREKFSGFTYYENTLSYGNSTNFAVPALLGGYEYTPVELNKRSSEKLVDKHNEALKLMPAIFSENDYQITICDPPYANYRWIPDLSIYDDYPNVEAYITKGRFTDQDLFTEDISKNHRNFFLFGLMKTLPLAVQPALYDEGDYRQISGYGDHVDYEKQTVYSMSAASGYRGAFMQAYDAVRNLKTMTRIDPGEKNSFLFFLNDITHEPMLLQTPDYIPSANVDNSRYDQAHRDRFTDPVTGDKLVTEKINQMTHYHTNVAMMLQLADWLDELRALGVYDNTRIIIASDHGRDLGQVENMIKNGPDGEAVDFTAYYPLLLVKDFDQEGFHTSDTFMTNADVPILAFDGLIDNPVNPFTGKPIDDQEKFAHEQYVILSEIYSTSENNGTSFLPSYWASVRDDIRETENWTLYPDEFVLDEHGVKP